MIRLRDISMQPGHNEGQLLYEAAGMLKIPQSKIQKLTILKKSIDARKKPDVRVIYTVDVAVNGNEDKILHRSGCKRAAKATFNVYHPPKLVRAVEQRPVIVGFGPAGMFAALLLAMAGCKPLVLERGDDALTRQVKVQHFFETGELDPKSNIQFGEGGAGTFSDGKLNTGVNNPRIGWILERFAEFGARENVLYDAKPHVGTDVLVNVVQNIRRRILELGGEVRFQSQVTGLLAENNALTGLQINNGEVIACTRAIFAIGHSARDTFEMLHDSGLPLEAKPFAMGVRIEQNQAAIDRSQYGMKRGPLPPADYKLVAHLEDRTAYTFCMCPGGYVVAAASEAGGTVTNGMSYADRNGNNANAALLISVNPADFPEGGPLAGMYWQREIERSAYRIGGYRAPAQRVGDFLSGIASSGAGKVEPTYRPGVTWCDLHAVLPKLITDAIAQALPELDQRLAGFADADAVMTAPETRSSSPVRILRDETRQAQLRGFYPCGEGAGYAGGIMSAAIDGLMSAEAIIREINENA